MAVFTPQLATIQSRLVKATPPTQNPTSALPSQVDLNFSTSRSFHTGSPSTATIQSQDFPVFTTDSSSTWLPSSSSSLPAHRALQHLTSPVEQPQQDFVLFDQPCPRTSQPRQLASPSALGQYQRRHSSLHLAQHSQQTRSSAIHQSHRSTPIKPVVHPGSLSRLHNRLGSPTQTTEFYASSAPSSSVALNQPIRRNLPPVPLFSQSCENPATKMDLHGSCAHSFRITSTC